MADRHLPRHTALQTENFFSFLPTVQTIVRLMTQPLKSPNSPLTATNLAFFPSTSLATRESFWVLLTVTFCSHPSGLLVPVAWPTGLLVGALHLPFSPCFPSSAVLHICSSPPPLRLYTFLWAQHACYFHLQLKNPPALGRSVVCLWSPTGMVLEPSSAAY